MNHASIFLKLRFQRYPCWGLPALLAVLFSLLGVALPNHISKAYTVTRPAQIGYSVNGTAFKDDNQDGAQNGTEPGINGIVVTAYTLRGATVITSTTKSISTLAGQYTLIIPAGTGPVYVHFSNFGPNSPITELRGLHSTDRTRDAAIRFVVGTQASNTLNLGLLEDSAMPCQNKLPSTTQCSIANHTPTSGHVTTSSSPTTHTTYFAPRLINPAITHKKYNFTTAHTSTSPTFVKRPFQKHTLLRVMTQPTFQGGQNISYSLIVSNSSSAGPVLAKDPITISDPIPAGLMNLTVSANSDWTTSLSATTSPATLTATYIGAYPVASGATLSTITLNGTLTSSAGSSLSNTATVSTPNDSDTNNNAGNSMATILPQPDLALTKTVPADTTFQVGHTVDFTLSVSNISTTGSVQPGSSITVTDTTPAGLTGMTVTANSNWTIALNSTSSPTTMTATYNAGPNYPVAPGTTLSPIVLHGTLTTNALSTFTNQATVSTPYDSNPDNNSASVPITVLPQPDMTITETVPTGATFQVGHTVTFTITGSDVSTAGLVMTGDPITITSAIPTGLTGLTTITNKDWLITFDSTSSPSMMNATYIGTYPVNPGTSLSPITLNGTLTTGALPTLTNPVTVTTPDDSNHANDNTSVTITVLPQPDLSLSKTVQAVAPQTRKGQSTHLLQKGQEVNYTIEVSNARTAGPVQAPSPVVITDNIPVGLTDLIANSNSDWQVTLSQTTSPTTLTATYIGPYPIRQGAKLSAITLRGTLTGEVVQLTNIATVSTPDDNPAGKNTRTGSTTVALAVDVAITNTHFGPDTFLPGQTIHYQLTVRSTNKSEAIPAGNSIKVIDPLPIGFNHVHANGDDWRIIILHRGRATVVVAIYVGHYPIAQGTWLPPIMVSTRVRGKARRIINTAHVIMPHDSDPTNNNSSDTIMVHVPSLPPTGSDPNTLHTR